MTEFNKQDCRILANMHKSHLDFFQDSKLTFVAVFYFTELLNYFPSLLPFAQAV